MGPNDQQTIHPLIIFNKGTKSNVKPLIYKIYPDLITIFEANCFSSMSLDSRVKNVIFDLGGVILNIDFDLAIQAFRQLGIPDFSSLYSRFKQSSLFDDLETGHISPEQLHQALSEHLPSNITPEQMDLAWNALLLDFPEENIRLLERLKNQGCYRLFLLSNTNIIHYRSYCEQLNQRFGYPNLGSLLEKEYYSFEMGVRKPDLRIYQQVLEDAQLRPEESIFIDDLEENIHAARKTGMLGHHLTGGETLTDLFADTV